MSQEEKPSPSAYKHSQKTVQRPDVGVEAQFANKKAPKTYRYDSSLAPELCWDENAERPFAEWLLNMITEAAEKGESVVFAQPQVWRGIRPHPNPSPEGRGAMLPSPSGRRAGDEGERFTSIPQCAARLKSLTKPFLNWAGKAERQRISVPTLPLFVHERHSTQAILETLKSHKASGANLDLFGDAELDIADKLDAYQHQGPWTNRLVLGDSLQVMNSLLEYEGLGGQVQMIYFDPPYGVKFGSNFQPFVRKRDVKHGADDEMIREPEMVKAYRDTWELGLHSYLAYLRDRLLLARELLHESGSIFVQISDDNLHHVTEVLDEVFGPVHKTAIIAFKKTGFASSEALSTTHDFILWYAKSSVIQKVVPVFGERELTEKELGYHDHIELSDGTRRPLTQEEKMLGNKIREKGRVFARNPMISPGWQDSLGYPFIFSGISYKPPANRHWATREEGMQRLKEANRLAIKGNTLRFVRFFDDFALQPLGTIWNDT